MIPDPPAEDAPEDPGAASGASLGETIEEAEDRDIAEGEHREEFGEDL